MRAALVALAIVLYGVWVSAQRPMDGFEPLTGLEVASLGVDVPEPTGLIGDWYGPPPVAFP